MTWNVTTPDGSEAVSQGDDRIRELKVDIANGLNASDALGNAGTFPGASAAVPTYHYRGLKGTQAQLPTAGNYGLYHNTDLNALQRDTGSTWNTIGIPALYMRLPRPSFMWDSTDTTRIKIPASATKPAIVNIRGAFYYNTSDYVLDIDTAGVAGLDTGTKAANTIYYLYAVLPAAPTTDTTFRATMSVTPPTAGPTGFGGNWSYLGSMCTSTGSATFEPFQYCNGTLNRSGGFGTAVNVSSSTVSAKTLKISTIATQAYCRFTWVTINAVGNDLTVGPTSGSLSTFFGNPGTTTASSASQGWGWLPITESQTIYAATTSSSDSIDITPYAWTENVLDHQ